MIHFVVDSTFNIDNNYATENNIHIVSLKIELNNEVYLESDHQGWNKFYDELKVSNLHPKTSCPTPNDFSDSFEHITTTDKEAKIICLTFSQNLSGTYNSARIAVDEFISNNENQIELIDLKTYTCSSKLILEDAIEDIKSNINFEDIIFNIKSNIEKVWVKFMPFSMEPLKKGGRVSLLKSIIADTLKIKPVLSFRNSEFKLHKLALGVSMALSHLVNSIPKNFKKINLMYIYDNSLVTKLKLLVSKFLNRNDIELVALGPVAGAHIGIGSIGVAVLEY